MELETIAGVNLPEIYSQVEKQFTSTGHVVLSDIDLLGEILHRLPVLSILRFKFVSKQWLFVIKSPNFITLWRNKNPNLDPPSGLFLEIHNFCNQLIKVTYDFVWLDTANKSALHTDFPFGSDDEDNVRILHSCNGLLLCFIRPCKLFVYNPTTNQSRKLSEEHCSELANGMFNFVKLAFDPTKSPHYKVIVGTINDNDNDDGHFIQIKTYSSETNDWSVYPQLFPSRCFRDFIDGIYWNGAFHWLDTTNEVLHYKLDVNQMNLTTIQNPGTGRLDEKMYTGHKLFESRGCLLLAWNVFTFSTRNEQLEVYEMRIGCCEWSVKYVINIDDIRTLLPMGCAPRDLVMCIVLGEREEESFLVLKVYGKTVQYNVVLKTLCENDLSPRDFSWRCFLFIPSLASV